MTSLHYYFPWAMKALLRWSTFCVVTGRKARTQVDTDPWFAIADDEPSDGDDDSSVDVDEATEEQIKA